MIDRRHHVGLDGLNLALTRGTGVATYARAVARAVAGMGRGVDLLFGLDVAPDASPGLRETLFFSCLDQAPADDGGARSRPTARALLRRAFVSPRPRMMIDIPSTGRVDRRSFTDRIPPHDRLFSYGSLWNVAARHFRRYGDFLTVRIPDPPAVMHWTYPLPIMLAGAANIYTIHDLVPLKLPHTSLEDKAYHDRLIARCVATAARICTVSDASRRDILAMFPTAPERVVNCYQAIESADLPPPDALAAKLRALFDLERGGYFLFFGGIEPKKNVGRLIEAYLAADRQTPLVLAGGRSWKAEGELRLLDTGHGVRLSGAARIRQIDYLPRRLLDLLIGGARAVLFPSLDEGFGLPPAEAMAAGVPVLVSTAAALTEIAGDGAIAVDPYDVTALSAAIVDLDTDAPLRARLSAAGAARAREFTSARFQRRLEGLYEDAVSARPPRSRHDG